MTRLTNLIGRSAQRVTTAESSSWAVVGRKPFFLFSAELHDLTSMRGMGCSVLAGSILSLYLYPT